MIGASFGSVDAASLILAPHDQDGIGKSSTVGDRNSSADNARVRSEIGNLCCLGTVFMTYFAFRSGCLIVLPLTCKLLLKQELGGQEYSPLYDLPLTLWFVMDILVATPNALFMQRKGWRAGFVVGIICALVGSLVAFCGLSFISNPWVSFIVLNVAVVIMSILGMAEFVRYAAAEACADADRRPVVVSRVLTFAAIAASCGPLSSSLAEILTEGMGLVQGYAIFFLFLAGFTLFGLVAALGLKLPPVGRASSHVAHVPLMQILRRPGVWCGLFSQVAVQFAMVTPMSGVPLAMEAHLNLLQSPGNLDISVCVVMHVLGMFLPGFVTGNLVKKLGKFPIMAAGLCIQAVSLVICLCGTQEMNFYVGLVLLGIGWNCAFVSGTVLLVESLSMEERARVTSINETLRFVANGVGVLLSSTFPWWILISICLSVLGILGPVMFIACASIQRAK